ncbi:MAG TPA: DEAD/DEAH box helicase [Clostridiales bacterium]|nr:DEAD/DEAH box helicase [Clostridiales bacterium]
MADPLGLFEGTTARWFQAALGGPTAVQEEAWPAIAAGGHVLVSAPTGTGKTLSAFLVYIDQLVAQARKGSLAKELQLIYVSPLKSLAGDIRENLRRPLNGILEEERKDNPSTAITPFDIKIAIRTGDTPQKERRSMIKNPPHILITTPESLFLMLTSRSGQGLLQTAKAIIIDELHALVDSKRGAHLMLSIARLDRLCGRPLQRIGLSATMEPLETAAGYLSPDEVRVVAPRMKKAVELKVTSPWPDYQQLQKDSIWQELSRTVYEHCRGLRSVIAFVEGRAYAEKLAYYVNLLGGEEFARTHHGSLSKEQRFAVEEALRDGKLRLLCATSSMELGIDVGDIDQVFQIGCPRSVSSTMQRLGRAGHNPGRTSVMHIFPRTASEGLYCGLTAEAVRMGGVEHMRPPRLCLDVLAQHLVSMAAGDGYSLEEVMEVLPRAYPFAEVTKEDVKEVLCMLAGDYEHDRNIPVRPRVLYDRIHERVEGDTYSRLLAVSAAGTIPDKGLFTVKTESGVKLGEVDEEFVFEQKEGTKFLLGSFAWQIVKIQKDAVLVKQSSIYGARPPFYRAEITGRRLQTGMAFGKLLGKLNRAYEEEELEKELGRLGMDHKTVRDAEGFIRRQIEATGILPNDSTLVVEHFQDETGSHQLMVHSVFGRQINAPLALLAKEAARKHVRTNISCFDDDDGFLLFPYGESVPDGRTEIPAGILEELKPEMARPVLEAILPSTPVFNMAFRYNAGHALMMGVRKAGRQPLWIQRLRSAQMLDSLIKYKDHPLIRETKRECLEDLWDLKGVEYVLHGIQSGAISIREIYLDKPSPMSLPLRHQTEATMMYEYSLTTMGVHIATEEALDKAQMIAPAPEQLALVAERRRLPEDEKQLHSLLMIEGDLIAGELPVPVEWLELLVHREQAKYIEPGLWIAAEHEEKYTAALERADKEARLQIVLRLLRYRGPWTAEQLGERYLWPEEQAEGLLQELLGQGALTQSGGLYYHAELYDRAVRETIKDRRRQIKTLPSQRYASLLTGRLMVPAPPGEQLEAALELLCDQPYAPQLWEGVLLPRRVTAYRTELLEAVLSQGNMVWSITGDLELCFHRYEDIDWEADMTGVADSLEGSQKVLYETLLKRGASFMQRLSGLLEGNDTPYDVLMGLMEKGLVCADSFLPVRQWMNKESMGKTTLRGRVAARAKALTTGRFEITRPLKALTMEQKLERIFERVIILSRETLQGQGVSWAAALETLRVWEYTGRVRRGYFIEGLSGIQFIRDKDFARVMQELEQPGSEVLWLSSVDPAQPWGKYFPHMQDRAFINVAGTAVALREGRPVAVLERQGKGLRVFEQEHVEEVMGAFVHDFRKKRLFTAQNRIVVKQYPPEAAEALAKAGFLRELQDYVLYR